MISCHYGVFISGELIKGYPQRMGLQWLWSWIFTICSLIYVFPCNYKLLFFFAKSSNKPYIDHIQGRRLNFNLGSAYLKRGAVYTGTELTALEYPLIYGCEPYPTIYSVVRSSLTNCTSVEPSVHFPNQTFPRSLRKCKQKPQGANKT